MILYLVYETDIWHSTETKNLMGVFTSKTTAINFILNYSLIVAGEVLDYHEIVGMSMRECKASVRRVLRKELEDNWQTQGYRVNYEIEKIKANEWL